MGPRRSPRVMMKMAVSECAKQRMSRYLQRDHSIDTIEIHSGFKRPKKCPRRTPNFVSKIEKLDSPNLMGPEELTGEPACSKHYIISWDKVESENVEEDLGRTAEVPDSSTVNLIGAEELTARPKPAASSVFSFSDADWKLKETADEPDSPIVILNDAGERKVRPKPVVNSVISSSDPEWNLKKDEVPDSHTVNWMDTKDLTKKLASTACSVISLSDSERTLEEAAQVSDSSTVNLMDGLTVRPASSASSVFSHSDSECNLDETVELPDSSTVNMMEAKDLAAKPKPAASSNFSFSESDWNLKKTAVIPDSPIVNWMDIEELTARPASSTCSIFSHSGSECNLNETPKFLMRPKPAASATFLLPDAELHLLNTASDSSSADSKDYERKSDSTDADGKCSPRPKKLNPTEKRRDFQSDISTIKNPDTEDIEDLGLEILNQNMVELLTSKADSTLPFIGNYWKAKIGEQFERRFLDPKRMRREESEGFVHLLNLKTNTYFVLCQLDCTERQIMNWVAKRWNWTRDDQLSHDTKYIIVKEESIIEKNNGIPENAIMAIAAGGCVLLFSYVLECKANNQLAAIRESHLPSHKGVRRKMLEPYSSTPFFKDFAFFISPEISPTGRHVWDYFLLRNVLKLTSSRLCSSLGELRRSPATYKVALRSTAISTSDDVKFVHYHWLYECILNYRLYSMESYACDFTSPCD